MLLDMTLLSTSCRSNNIFREMGEGERETERERERENALEKANLGCPCLYNGIDYSYLANQSS